MHTSLICEVARINNEYGLEISLDHISHIYGEPVLDHLAEMLDDVIANIEFLLSLGFGDDVSDICNRFGIILCEDTFLFSKKVSALVDSIGSDFIAKMGEDMSLWETIM